MQSVAVHVIALLLWLCTSPAIAYFYTGNELKAKLDAYNRAGGPNATGVDFQEGQNAMGYITGVYDALSATSLCTQGQSVTVAQTVAIVSRYVRDHPEQWGRSAYVMVVSALVDAFPCARK
jgi:hypothetical protein